MPRPTPIGTGKAAYPAPKQLSPEATDLWDGILARYEFRGQVSKLLILEQVCEALDEMRDLQKGVDQWADESECRQQMSIRANVRAARASMFSGLRLLKIELDLP